ncbi:hypothetical protein Zm00014a_005505 [Zea mays]|jgi:hypothetical protein|uniref:Uncharacterized protein n=1 Tax=Zea mays TaxID=4577 RepID=A0A3L6FDL7_MAIZE|nr:hypothetical protein Zm00014a_005505 [Zea mays]
MKLSDANLAPEKKYAHNRLQAEMEAFLRTKDDESASHTTALREARLINVTAAATSSSPVEVDAEPLLPIAAAERKRERDHDGRTDEIQLDWIKVSGPDASVVRGRVNRREDVRRGNAERATNPIAF